jgi:outer membrane receptor protein involved in Fe transport
MSTSYNVALPLTALCLAYNLSLTGFRLSTFELYNPLKAVATTASIALVNAAVWSLRSGDSTDTKVKRLCVVSVANADWLCAVRQTFLQLLLAFGGLAIVNLDRISGVVGKRYTNADLTGKVYVVTGSNTGIGRYLYLFNYDIAPLTSSVVYKAMKRRKRCCCKVPQ